MCPRCNKTTFQIINNTLKCTGCGLTERGHVRAKKAWKTRRKARTSRAPLALAFTFATMLLVLGIVVPPQAISYAVTTEEKKQETYLGISHQGVVTGYNSLPEQTDDTPFETASGQRTRDGIVANNCLKFGTRVIIGEKTFEVQDRMNKRYGCEHYDIWMEYKSDAVQWGVQRMEVVEIVDMKV